MSAQDPYRHQEMQLDYYEPARLYRPKMLGSGPISLLVFLGLDASYGVFLCLDYLPNGLAFFGVQAALVALALWSRRSAGEADG